MAWTTPRTWSIGEFVTKAIMDLHIRDNLNYLKGQIDLAGVMDTLLHISHRQGGNALAWNVQGSTNYDLSTLEFKALIGAGSFSSVSNATGTGLYYANINVIWPTAFTQAPIVIASPFSGAYDLMRVSAYGSTTTQGSFQAIAHASIGFPGVPFHWIAIGQTS